MGKREGMGKRENMKKSIFLFTLLGLMLIFAACGKKEEPVEYYDIRVESQILEDAELGQLLLGRQYYQGEPVSLIAEQVSAEDGTSVMDVYIQPVGKERQLLLSGVSRAYRSSQWYLDGDGNCYIPQTDGVIRLDTEASHQGNMLYHSKTDGWVRDICGLENGRIILLIYEKPNYGLAELDPATGTVTKISNVVLGSETQYIGASGDRLMILNTEGFWYVNLKKGTKTLELPLGGTFYTFPEMESVVDFQVEGNEAGIIWSSGMEERLARVSVSEDREIIIVRGYNFSSLEKEKFHLFNQTNDTYYAVLEVPGEGISLDDFRTETNLKLASGKGADIIYGVALHDDLYGILSNGIFADLTPFMEASGMSEEDFFPAAFGGWRYEGKIYGVSLLMDLPEGYTMDQSLLGSGKELTIETFLDIMLDPNEKRILLSWMKDERKILEYLLQGSENLWGMVDWEKGTCDFSGELFSKMLQAAKRCVNDGQQDYPAILEWRDAGGFYTYETDSEMESKNRMMAGALFDDGCHPRIRAYYGIMGINAKSKQMEGAWQLLAFLLGEEAQSKHNEDGFDFPMNKKAFDRVAQKEMEVGAIIYNTKVIAGVEIKTPSYIKGDGKDLTQEVVDDIIQYLEEVRPLPIRTKPLIKIILEDTEDYFNGRKSEEEVIDVMQNRVQLYLDEQGKRK